MPSAKLTSKGQITIPKDVRKALGLQTGDRLSFEVREGTMVVKPAKISLLSLYGSMRTKKKGVTVEMMNEAILRAHRE